MESSEESLFSGSGALWVLAFDYKNLGEKNLIWELKIGRHSRIFFLERISYMY